MYTRIYDRQESSQFDMVTAKKKGKESLLEVGKDMKKMLNNPDYSDVVFFCKDGGHVHASRLFLAARNDYFLGMFLNGMAESWAGSSKISEISLPEISSRELHPVMEYLYQGRLEEHMPKDWSHASELLVAARFFCMPQLQHFIIKEYVMGAVEDVQRDGGAAVKMLSFIVEYVNLPDEAVEHNSPAHSDVIQDVLKSLVDILMFASLKPKHVQYLSESALLFFLDETKITSDPSTQVLSTTEFVRFRILVLWCACKKFQSGRFFPSRRVSQEILSIAKLLKTSSDKQNLFTRKKHAIACKLSSSLAASLSQYLPLVNFQHFAPDDLIQVVAPMSIVPSSCVQAALRFHELRGHFEREEQTLGWTTCQSNMKLYKMDDYGCHIQQHEQGKGYANYKLCMPNGVPEIYEWEVIIEEICEDFIEIGLLFFHKLDAEGYKCCRGNYPEINPWTFLDPMPGRNLSEMSSAYALRMDDRGISVGFEMGWHGSRDHTIFVKDCKHLVYGRDYAQKGSKVKLSLDMSNMACSVIVDDEDFGEVWTGMVPESSLPVILYFDLSRRGAKAAGSYFPVVSLGSGATGSVRIQVLRVGDRQIRDPI